MTTIQRTQASQQDRLIQDAVGIKSQPAPTCTWSTSEKTPTSAPQVQSLLQTIQTALKTVQQVTRLFNRLLKTFNQANPVRSTTKNSTRSSVQSQSASVTNSKLTQGFLWKPASDKDGKLAILLPPSLTGTVRSVSITSPTGAALETGAFAGTGNGDREHFRFGKNGGQYPDGSLVAVTFKDGSTTELLIKDTAARVER